MPGQPVYSYTNNETNGTVVIRTGAGVLHAIIINTKGASSNTLSIYDGITSGGDLIATFDTTTAFGTFLYDVAFSDGLTIVSATGTAAKATIAWAAL